MPDALPRPGRLRRLLGGADAIAALSLLALPTGLFAGAVVIVFRVVTERSLVWLQLLPAVDRYEALPPLWRFGLPALGGLAIGLLFQAVPAAIRAVGPAHVMHCLTLPGARVPWPNALLQFVGGAASIIVGHAVGREGPVIHVGAASASLLGERLGLSLRSQRTLVACGVAAAIAGCFNTPLAGVVFAMEVVMLEYSLLGFAPVILAAVSATVLSRSVFGEHAAFQLQPMHLASALEIPWVLLMGAVIGSLAATYVAGIIRLDRATRPWPIWLRMTAGGLTAGVFGVLVPEVMGLGYDTVEDALLGHLTLGALVMIALAKLAATIACGGLALPGGLIGPMLVIGACAGGAVGMVGGLIAPDLSAPHAFYATLGAVAMMGACLQAPLAALTAILELTANPNVILPGMAAVMAAFLVARVGFRQLPMYVALLNSRGLPFGAAGADEAGGIAGTGVASKTGRTEGPGQADPARGTAPASGSAPPAADRSP